MINFHAFCEDTSTPLSLNENQTIFELKDIITSALSFDFDEISIVLGNYGILDTEDTLDLPLSYLGLAYDQVYRLFILNVKHPEMLWKVFCTEKILGDAPITQVGFCLRENGKQFSICQACHNFCQRNYDTLLLPEVILENNFQCLCGYRNDSKCSFASSPNYGNRKDIMFQNIHSLLVHHADVRNKRENSKIEEINQKILARTFDFEKSIHFGLQRVILYEEKEVQEKVLGIIPLSNIESDAQEKAKQSGLGLRDEFVKSLLSWFKHQFYTWCDKPNCIKCGGGKRADGIIETREPNEEEKQWKASRTEIYLCNQCGSMCRFPRYNNPAKLCDTRTGRCGEWANLFGSILRCLGYEVRFVDNFEDHVWNEYWSESLQRWVHVDSCENAWDTPLLYEQGWKRNMTFVLAHSVKGVYDVTRRYVKNWGLISRRRRQVELDRLDKLLEQSNNMLRQNFTPEEIEYLALRDACEKSELLQVKSIHEVELIGRQSGCEEWRKERGEFK